MAISQPVIGIVGGGAAGLMAAATLAEAKPFARILLFEKNSSLGAKVLISGGGRCNVTSGVFDVRKLLENYPRGAKFLMSALYRFSPEKVMEWFENHGVKLIIEEDLRVFPASNRGEDIVGALEHVLRLNHVEIRRNAPVVSVQASAQSRSPSRRFSLLLKSGESIDVDFLLLTTGGNAYRHTGSTGDGYAFAQQLGHAITPCVPSLSSFLISESWVSSLAGVSMHRVELCLHPAKPRAAATSEEKIYRRKGDFLFTHKGVTGPAIFALSAMAAYDLCDGAHPGRLTVNFFPDKRPEDVREMLLELIRKNPKKRIPGLLDFLLPKSLAGVVVEVSGVNPLLLAANLRKEQVASLVKLLHEFPLTVVGRSAGEEFVTAGGVDLAQVNTNTLESRLCPGLYFAGEILDIDGFTGGFNLQAAWAGGRLAGESILQALDS